MGLVELGHIAYQGMVDCLKFHQDLLKEGRPGNDRSQVFFRVKPSGVTVLVKYEDDQEGFNIQSNIPWIKRETGDEYLANYEKYLDAYEKEKVFSLIKILAKLQEGSGETVGKKEQELRANAKSKFLGVKDSEFDPKFEGVYETIWNKNMNSGLWVKLAGTNIGFENHECLCITQGGDNLKSLIDGIEHKGSESDSPVLVLFLDSEKREIIVKHKDKEVLRRRFWSRYFESVGGFWNNWETCSEVGSFQVDPRAFWTAMNQARISTMELNSKTPLLEFGLLDVSMIEDCEFIRVCATNARVYSQYEIPVSDVYWSKDNYSHSVQDFNECGLSLIPKTFLTHFPLLFNPSEPIKIRLRSVSFDIIQGERIVTVGKYPCTRKGKTITASRFPTVNNTVALEMYFDQLPKYKTEIDLDRLEIFTGLSQKGFVIQSQLNVIFDFKSGIIVVQNAKGESKKLAKIAPKEQEQVVLDGELLLQSLKAMQNPFVTVKIGEGKEDPVWIEDESGGVLLMPKSR